MPAPIGSENLVAYNAAQTARSVSGDYGSMSSVRGGNRPQTTEANETAVELSQNYASQPPTGIKPGMLNIQA